VSTPSIRDVARRAGVSPATVSRVVNGSAPVTGPLAAKVHDAVSELGFRPSSLARGLSLGRTGTIGVIAPFFTHWGTLGRLQGMTTAAGVEDYDLMIFNVGTPRQREDALLKFARRDRVDGVLVVSVPLSDQDVVRLRRDALPIVLVDVTHPALSRVTIDDVAGGRLATEHLMTRGHARVGFVGDLPEGPLGFTASEDRRRGYEQALAGAGLSVDPELIRRGLYGRESARALAQELLRLDAPPTAIFAASDMQAIGVLEAADAAGVRVPDGLAVIGFDDIEIAEILGLTTIHQPLEEIGANAMELLLADLRGGHREPLEVFHPLTLVERRTT
jgi:LacI family transcriptional regulator/LacI family repressor for deo operon, udp, cdd, tsx, nupC, and nupG